MSVLAAVLGFLTFLLLLPARIEHLDIDYADRPGESFTHCSTHLGWQDVLGPASCSRWGAAAVGVVVTLVVLSGSRWSARRSAGAGRGAP
jgi:hypothetical protein